MESFYFLCEFFLTAVKTTLSIKLIAAFAEPKFDERVEQILQGLFVFIVAAANTYNNSMGVGIFSNSLLLIIVFLTSVFSKLLYQVKIYSIFSITFGLWGVITLCDFFLLLVLYLVFENIGFPVDVFVEISIYRAVYLFVFALGLIVMGVGLCKTIKKYDLVFRRTIDKIKYWSVVPVILLGVFVIYFQRIYKLLVTDRYIAGWFVFCICGIGLTIAFLIYRALNKEKEKDALQEMKMHMLEKNYKALLKNHEEKGILLHDMKNHMVILSDMIEAGEKQKALDYIDQICNGLRKGARQLWTHHAILDPILNAKIQEAQDESIDIQIECDDLSDMTLLPIDICALFTNLMDNAIEANLRQNPEMNRWIRMICKRQGYMLIVTLSNPSDEIIDSRDGIPATSKNDKTFHGYGMRSIKKVLDKYNGNMKYSTLEGTFKIVIGLVGFCNERKPIMDAK